MQIISWCPYNHPLRQKPSVPFQMSKLRLSKVKYFDHRDLEVQGQYQESNPSLLHRLCFPPNSRHIPPPCSALHHLEAAPGPPHWQSPQTQLCGASRYMGMHFECLLRGKDSCPKNVNIVTTLNHFILSSPFIQQIADVCQAQMVGRRQNSSWPSPSSQPARERKAQTHTC